MPSLSANQLVAYNLARVRKMRGLEQDQAAELLAPFLGVCWSKAVYSAAERSYDGKRVRKFTADDLVAMSAAFGVPIPYFFLPPPEEQRRGATAVESGDREIGWKEMFDVMLGGKYRMAFAQRAFELPRDERVDADSYLARIINGMGLPRSLEEHQEMTEQLRKAFPEQS